MTIFSPVFFKKNFEDPKVMRRLNGILKEKRDYDFKMPPKNSPVILIVSGGLDSIMLWFNLLNKYRLQVYPIHFVGPHSNLGEKKSVEFFFDFFRRKFPHLVKPPIFFPSLFNFSFKGRNSEKILNSNPGLIINNLYFNRETKNKKVFFVKYPTRLAYYALAAYECGLLLQTKGVYVHTIFTGVVPDDGVTTRESTLTVLRALNIYLCTILGDWHWQITGPLEKKQDFYFSKTKALNIAKKENIPVDRTWSCGAYYFRHCGVCSACKRRQLAFKEARIPDKTTYLISPKVYRILKKVYGFFLKFPDKEIAIKTRPTGKKLLNSNIFLSPDVIDCKEKKRVYFFNKKSGEFIEINLTGLYIFQLLKKNPGLSVSELITKLARRFPDINSSQLKRDLLLFIGKMVTKKNFCIK